MDKKIESILILGGGPSDLGHESEQDAAAFQAFNIYQKMGIKIFIIDNNPFSMMLEKVDKNNVFVEPINTSNVERIIETNKISAITSIYGGKTALKVLGRLIKKEIIQKNNIQLLGFNNKTVELMNNNFKLRQNLIDHDIHIITSNFASNYEEALEISNKIGFPVSVKSIDAKVKINRVTCKNIDQLIDAVDEGLEKSNVDRVSIEKDIVGYKEIETVVIRDTNGNKNLIASLENMNPVGINSTDSVVFSPVQTLTDSQYQTMRNISFKVTEILRVKGVCHIQFSLNVETDEIFVLKINPYFNMSTALASKSNGYPLEYIIPFLLLDYELENIELPSKYDKNMALLEPISDHITVRIPIWPFDEFPKINRKLSTKIKTIGSAIGIGRTPEAALIKALRSSESSPKDIFPDYSYLSEDEIVSELIYPTNLQLLIIFEAVRRKYPLSDLTEITKINIFYFKIIDNIVKGTNQIKKNKLNDDSIELAHKLGFGDSLLSDLWDIEVSKIKKLSNLIGNKITYKMIEPSAGEFDSKINSFYSSYESFNESNKETKDSVLIIGKGKNNLGPNVASDIYTAEMSIKLHRLGYKTIILNNNPNSVSLLPLISDKQYIEPIQISDILDIINNEKPKYVFVPGNRHYLINQLNNNKKVNSIVLPPNQKKSIIYSEKGDFALDFLVYDDKVIPITSVGFGSEINNNENIEYLTDYYVPFSNINKYNLNILSKNAVELIKKEKITGLIQVIFENNNNNPKIASIRPLRITETIFLNYITNINWIDILIDISLNQLNLNELLNKINQIKNNNLITMEGIFPFKSLGITDSIPSRSKEIGAKIFINYPK